MLNNLFNFSCELNIKESIFLYLGYLILISLTGAIGGILTGLISVALALPEEVFLSIHNKSFFTYKILVFLFCISCSLLFIIRKKLTCIKSKILFLFSIFLSFGGGDVLGLIPMAILSTFPNKSTNP